MANLRTTSARATRVDAEAARIEKENEIIAQD